MMCCLVQTAEALSICLRNSTRSDIGFSDRYLYTVRVVFVLKFRSACETRPRRLGIATAEKA